MIGTYKKKGLSLAKEEEKGGGREGDEPVFGRLRSFGKGGVDVF